MSQIFISYLRDDSADTSGRLYDRLVAQFGKVLGTHKLYAKALPFFDRALTLDPNDANAWSNKSTALRALGLEAQADEAERRAKALGR